MIISLIAAMDKQGGIGKDNRLPWRLPADMRMFKSLTMGHHLVMGRMTFESLPRLLPGRIIIVLSHNSNLVIPEGCLLAGSLDKAVEIAKRAAEDELFIAGGATLFEEGLNIAERLYITRIKANFEVDTWFPMVKWQEWRLVDCQPHSIDEKNAFDYEFQIWER